MISSILQTMLGVAGLATNAGMQTQTNKLNADLVRETNQANAEQAELAYKRSLPVNQVANLRAAGMSKAAAINHLNGGGSYTAPVMQSAQHQYSPLDFSGVMNAVGNIRANAQQAEYMDAQIRNLNEQTKNVEQARLASQLEQKREEETHFYNLLQQKYDAESRQKIDSLRSLILERANARNIDLSHIHTIGELEYYLGLNDSDLWRTSSKPMQDDVLQLLSLSSSLDYAASNEERASNADTRAQEQAQRDKQLHVKKMRELDDAHEVAKKHKDIASEEVAKLRREAEEWAKETDLREQKRKLESLRTQMNDLLQRKQLSIEQYSGKYYVDENGNLQLTRTGRMDADFREAWDMLGDVFGVGLLKDVLSGLVTLAPK